MRPVNVLGNFRQLHLVALSAMVDENHSGKDTILLPGIIVILPEFKPRDLMDGILQKHDGEDPVGDCSFKEDVFVRFQSDIVFNPRPTR